MRGVRGGGGNGLRLRLGAIPVGSMVTGQVMNFRNAVLFFKVSPSASL